MGISQQKNMFQYVATIVLCAPFSCLAYAQGSIVKQSKCRIMIEDIGSTAVGETLTLKLEDGSTATAKVQVVKPPRALADLDANSCAKKVIGATVVPKTKGSGKNTASPNSADHKKLSLGLALEGGWGSITIKEPVGDQTSLAYAGPEAAATLRLALPLNSVLSLAAMAGAGWHSKVIVVNADDGSGGVTSSTYSASSMFARAGAGAQIEIRRGLRIGSFGFFDYGFGATKKASASLNSAGTSSSFMRYGALAEFDFNITKGLWLGAGGSFFIGQIGGYTETYSDTGALAYSVAKFSSSGYCGNLKASYEF